MNWSKYGLMAFILIVVATIGFFGPHFVYSTGLETYGHVTQDIPQIVTLQRLLPDDIKGPYLVTFDTGFTKVLSYDEVMNYIAAQNGQENHPGVVQFLKDLALFNIKDTPWFISTFFDILVALLLFLIITSFTPFLPGG